VTALHPILVGTVRDAGLPLNPGDLVTYHGRSRWRHGDVHYVSAIGGDGLHLICDRDYPGVDPLEVRRNAIRPTGETVALCECGHEQGRQRTGHIDVCDAHPVCSCLQHPIRD
jgi:hypothetical protein